MITWSLILTQDLGCTDFSKNTEWALQEISQAVL